MAIRHAYADAQAPGQPAPHRDPRFEAQRRRQVGGDEAAGRANFAVVQLEVDSIEWLQVSERGDRRAIMRASRAWQVEPLVP